MSPWQRGIWLWAQNQGTKGPEAHTLHFSKEESRLREGMMRLRGALWISAYARSPYPLPAGFLYCSSNCLQNNILPTPPRRTQSLQIMRRTARVKSARTGKTVPVSPIGGYDTERQRELCSSADPTLFKIPAGHQGAVTSRTFCGGACWLGL